MLSNSYNNDKYTANTTSIFVPVKYKPQIEAVIEYQNTRQSANNGEFIAAIECSFGLGGDDNDYLLVTTQYGVFKRVLERLFDRMFVYDLLFAMELPQVDDDAYIRKAVATQELGNVWYCNDWLLPVPLEVHHAASEYAENWQEGNLDLLWIKPNGKDLDSAYYHNTTDDSYISVCFAVQTKTVNTPIIRMVESSTKGVLTQNW